LQASGASNTESLHFRSHRHAENRIPLNGLGRSSRPTT
jgi:hypothetical protein